MKYIRTKDENNLIIDMANMQLPYNLTDNYIDFNRFGIFKIVKQADTIEELCDEFVWKWDKSHFPSSTLRQFERIGGYGDLKREMRNQLNYGNYLNQDYEIYGAIWTDKGLIYVAKMNDEGELELL